MSVADIAAPETTEAPVKSRKKLLLIVAVATLVLAAGAWWFLIRPAGAEAKPTPGEVVQLEPIQVNLAGGHYLKIGIALQAVKGAKEVDSSKALDATIELFSGTTVEHLANAGDRAKLKQALAQELEHRYHGEVMEVYFTDFVTQ
jgi:flagellar FliL protein